ncbi:DUF6221 family protein [Streptomyces sp. NPDC091289]|uniref:DUF6221 family protein n=1 Tax=Streptomyces sp. NPDC091289 TaxID=3365989 RepID=UPI00380852E6
MQFLRDRLDEDEQAARAVGYEQIETADHLWGTKYLVLSAELGGLRATTEFDADLAEHIARHDPARVLAEVDAKRRMIETFMRRYEAKMASTTSTTLGLEWAVRADVLRLLALPYADHPDYRGDWRP